MDETKKTIADGENKSISKTSHDLTLNQLRLLGLALDLAETPVSLYGNDERLIYANAAARTCWPIMYASIEQGLDLFEATEIQIKNFAPHLSETQLNEANAYFRTSFNQTKPMQMMTDNGRRCQITHQPIGTIAKASLGIDITELHEKKQELRAAQAAAEFRAFHDALTSLPNRARFREMVETRMADDQTDSFWLLMCDIDKFKLVNDVYGHEVGDTVLIEFADFIKSIFGDDAFISRLGGDEFGILLSHESRQKLTAPILKRLANQKYFEISIGDQLQRVEFSIGAAQYPSDAGSYQKLLKYADLALLRSKKLGTGRIDFYDDQLGIAYSNELTLASDIETALVKGHITPHYQPIFDAKTRQLCGLEALVRWDHPTRGLLLPKDFSKIFSDRGLSLELSKYMLKAVSKQLSEWRKDGLPIFPININVEASDLLNQSFLSELLACLKSDEILPKNLGIEITENAILSVNDSALIQSLDAIRRLGVRVLLDDFGTGYSSLSYLSNLPMNEIKVDRTFIDKFLTNSQSESLEIGRESCRERGKISVVEVSLKKRRKHIEI